jgi:hypothetical protein
MAENNILKDFGNMFLDVLDTLKETGGIKNYAEFAKSIKLRPQAISDARAGRHTFTTEQILDTVKHYPQVNERFLLRGEEPKIFSEGFQIAQSEGNKPTGLEERVKELEEMVKKLSNR